MFPSNQCALVICALYIGVLKIGALRAQNPFASTTLVRFRNTGVRTTHGQPWFSCETSRH